MSWTDHVPRWLRAAVAPVTTLYHAVQLWSEAGGLRMSAAVSFYGILSLAPLLLVLVGILGWWLDRQVLEKDLISQLTGVIGQRGTAVIADTLRSAQQPHQGTTATLAGLAVLLFGATGVFTELQDALERLWSHGRPPQPRPAWWHAASLRLRGIGYVLVFGFLMLVSLVISTLLTLFSGWAGQWFAFEALVRALNELAAFAIGASLFVGLMRLSSGPKPRMRYLVIGGIAAALMFTAGRQLLAFYLSTAAVVSAYGAAGSLIVLLMWMYFSSAVLLLGAGLARAVEDARVGKLRRPPANEDAQHPDVSADTGQSRMNGMRAR